MELWLEMESGAGSIIEIGMREKKLWQKIIIRILYFTPFGYLLESIFLLSGEKTPGILIDLGINSPFGVVIKKKPSSRDRINWFLNSIVLFAQSWGVFKYASRGVNNSLEATYISLSVAFGLVCLLASVFPSIRWNRKLL